MAMRNTWRKTEPENASGMHLDAVGFRPTAGRQDAKPPNSTFALCSPCATMLVQKCRGRAIRTLVESGRPLRRDLNESLRGGTYERRKV